MSRTTSRASARPQLRRCNRSASPIWSPTVCSGESELIGSWKIMEIRPPRRDRYRAEPGFSRARSRGGSPMGRSGSANRIPPPVMWALPGRMPSTDRAMTDFPEPDSPTRATVPPEGTSNETPRTACTVPCSRRRNSTSRSRIERRGGAVPFEAEPGVRPDAGSGSRISVPAVTETGDSRAVGPGTDHLAQSPPPRNSPS